MTFFPLFIDKADIAIKIIITMIIGGEIYMNLQLIKFYEKNKEKFNEIGRRIRYMPAIWMLRLFWNIADFLLAGAIYVFYRDYSAVSESYYNNIAWVSLLFMFHIGMAKLHAFVFHRLKLILYALIMQFIVVVLTISLFTFFIYTEMTASAGYISVYIVWSLYLLYINFHWCRIEEHKV